MNSVANFDGAGTVFRITAAGNLTTLYNFCSQTVCADGYEPLAGLALGADGNFYGTTYSGGVNSSGTVFKITPDGTLTTLRSFCSTIEKGDCLDGGGPNGGLLQTSNLTFYATAQYGGVHGEGAIYSVTLSGALTVLHSLCCQDGDQPRGSLIQGTTGDLYGTASSGGTMNSGAVFRISLQNPAERIGGDR